MHISSICGCGRTLAAVHLLLAVLDVLGVSLVVLRGAAVHRPAALCLSRGVPSAVVVPIGGVPRAAVVSLSCVCVHPPGVGCSLSVFLLFFLLFYFLYFIYLNVIVFRFKEGRVR